METFLVGVGDKQSISKATTKRQSEKFSKKGRGVHYSTRISEQLTSKTEEIYNFLKSNSYDISKHGFETSRKGVVAAFELASNNQHAGIMIIEDTTDAFYDDKQRAMKHQSARLKVTFVANATKEQYLNTPLEVNPDYMINEEIYKNSVDILYLNKSSESRPAVLKNFKELMPEVFFKSKKIHWSDVQKPNLN